MRIHSAYIDHSGILCGEGKAASVVDNIGLFNLQLYALCCGIVAGADKDTLDNDDIACLQGIVGTVDPGVKLYIVARAAQLDDG